MHDKQYQTQEKSISGKRTLSKVCFIDNKEETNEFRETPAVLVTAA
jgi:hypothetical protein